MSNKATCIPKYIASQNVLVKAQYSGNSLGVDGRTQRWESRGYTKYPILLVLLFSLSFLFSLKDVSFT